MTDKQTNKDTPKFKGLNFYREDYFSFYIPIDWHKVDWADGRDGIMFIPKEDDAHTFFAVEVADLGTQVTPDDLPYIAKGFHDGIKQLPDGKILEKHEKVTGKLIQLMAKYTFTDEGKTRQRWVRILYNDTRQVTFTAQGSTEEVYAYWLPMFNEAMMTLNVHRQKPDFPTG